MGHFDFGPTLGEFPELIKHHDDPDAFCGQNALYYAVLRNQPVYENADAGVTIDRADELSPSIAHIACQICEVECTAELNEEGVPVYVNNYTPDGEPIFKINTDQPSACKYRELYTPDYVFGWED